MTRREAERAVLDAARDYAVEMRNKLGLNSLYPHARKVVKTVDALDACTEPDLDALNAAVEVAGEKWISAFSPSMMEGWCSESRTLRDAIIARRAALKPKPRYEATDATRILDNHTGYLLTANCIAALLNEAERG